MVKKMKHMRLDLPAVFSARSGQAASSSDPLTSGASQPAAGGIKPTRSMSIDSNDQMGDDIDHNEFQPDYTADHDSDSQDTDNHEAAEAMCTTLRQHEVAESGPDEGNKGLEQ
jgi:hypothetical protein